MGAIGMARTGAPTADRAWSGAAWLALTVAAGALAFHDGLAALLRAWALPEYSHGPLIPVISGYLFLRQMKEVPPADGPVTDRWQGGLVMLLALALGLVGSASGIGDIVAYAIIVWVGGVVLAGFGWRRGRQFWPPVLHLSFMLPLPGVIYYKATIALQFVASEIGVLIIQAAGVPVVLDGNVIGLEHYKLQVAEACSGLRYLFPVMSFTYIFAVLYRGSVWHKGALLLAAAPITVLMNAFRVGVIGIMVDRAGLSYAEGFMHFFEGWVIFMLTIAAMVGLSALMQRLRGDRRGIVSALDLNRSGVAAQMLRIGDFRPSGASAVLALAGGLWLAAPALGLVPETGRVSREPFALFPRQIGAWETTSVEILDLPTARALGADDYLSRRLASPEARAEVDLFVAWYQDQARGGIHSPEICIPGSGWEIAAIETIEAPVALPGGGTGAITLNRAVIQKGLTRQMVYYWFDQRGRRIASDYLAKAYLVIDGVRTGRTDGALMRLITPIRADETDADAEARLQDALAAAMPAMPGFMATDWPGAAGG